MRQAGQHNCVLKSGTILEPPKFQGAGRLCKRHCSKRTKIEYPTSLRRRCVFCACELSAAYWHEAYYYNITCHFRNISPKLLWLACYDFRLVTGQAI